MRAGAERFVIGTLWVIVLTRALAALLVSFAAMLTNAQVKAGPRLLPGVRRTKCVPRGHSLLSFTINECVSTTASGAHIGVHTTVEPVVIQSTVNLVAVVGTIDGVVAGVAIEDV
jgi:hypothetical protein